MRTLNAPRFLTVILLSFSVLSIWAGDVKQDVQMERAMLDLQPQVKPEKPRKVLVYTRANGFVHGSIQTGAKCFQMIGEKTGAFEVTKISDDPSVFAPDSLAGFDAIVLMSTTGNFLLPASFKTMSAEDKQKAKEVELTYRKSLLDFVTSGKGLVGIHAATDAYYNDWHDYGDLIGGFFNGHPWGNITVRIDDPKSPLTAQFEGKEFNFSDEIYTYKDTYSREKLHILLSVDLEASKIKGGENRKDHDYAVAWIREYGKGRVFSTLLGHNDGTYRNPLAVKFYLAGIQYALGDLKADATPSGPLPAAPADAAAAKPDPK